MTSTWNLSRSLSTPRPPLWAAPSGEVLHGDRSSSADRPLHVEFHRQAGKGFMRRVGLLVVTICLLLATAFGSRADGGDTSESSEYLIKAGFIYNFAKLVEWPATAFPQPDSPIVIGILGNDPFGATLDRIVADKKISGRVISVKRVKWGKDFKELKDCNILFVSSSEKEHIDSVVEAM